MPLVALPRASGRSSSRGARAGAAQGAEADSTLPLDLTDAEEAIAAAVQPVLMAGPPLSRPFTLTEPYDSALFVSRIMGAMGAALHAAFAAAAEEAITTPTSVSEMNLDVPLAKAVVPPPSSMPASLIGAFDLVDPMAVAYVNDRGGELIAHITPTVQTDVQRLLTDAIQNGVTDKVEFRRLLQEQARLLMLPDSWQRQLEARYPAGMASPGFVADLQAMHRRRAELWARTESALASQGGRLAGFQSAQASGLLGPNAGKRWKIGPERTLTGRGVCPRCQPMASHPPIPIDTPFSTPFGPLDNPPMHPMCRCSILLVPDITIEPGYGTRPPVGMAGATVGGGVGWEQALRDAVGDVRATVPGQKLTAKYMTAGRRMRGGVSLPSAQAREMNTKIKRVGQILDDEITSRLERRGFVNPAGVIARYNKAVDDLIHNPPIGGDAVYRRRLAGLQQRYLKELSEVATKWAAGYRDEWRAMLVELGKAGDISMIGVSPAKTRSMTSGTIINDEQYRLAHEALEHVVGHIPQSLLPKRMELGWDSSRPYTAPGRPHALYAGYQPVLAGNQSLYALPEWTRAGFAQRPVTGMGVISPQEQSWLDSAVFHEFGHVMEQKPVLRAIEWTEQIDRNYTVGGIDIGGEISKNGELYHPDRYSHAYVGRDYGNGSSSYYEIVSTGIQWLFSGAPIGVGVLPPAPGSYTVWDYEQRRLVMGIFGLGLYGMI